MKYIYNKWIPFKDFTAMCVGPLVFVRKDKKISQRQMRHETIHAKQWDECLYVFFLLIYVLSFIWQFCRYWKWMKAYENICFESEAYAHQSEEDYLSNRKHFAWLRNS